MIATVVLCPDQLHSYGSQIFAGLYELKYRREIDLRLSVRGFPEPPKGSKHREIIAMRLIVENSSRPINVVIDLIDGTSISNDQYFDWADVYLKSSLGLSSGLRQHEKVLPFGLRYACTSPNESVFDRLLFCLIGVQRKPRSWSTTVTQPAHLLLSRFKATQELCKLPPNIEFFEGNSESVEPVIYYRTRVYDPTENVSTYAQKEFPKVNAMRVSCIRALREAFGSAFLGGIRDSAYARRYCPDLVLENSWGWRDHVNASRRSLVCVTTSGLFNSIDWKLLEYFAAGRAVVSERLKLDLPRPPLENRDFLSFTNAEECVDQCRRVLNSRDDLAPKLRSNATTYYQTHCTPLATMRLAILESVRLVSESENPELGRSLSLVSN